MKHRRLLFIAIPVCLASCRSNTSPSQESAREAPSGAEVSTAAPQADTSSCYRAISGKDSVLLYIHRTGNAIQGDLVYTFFEKDNNTGTLAGQLSGDTLFAEYKFTSEGQQSVREVAFLKRGNELVEGFGSAKEAAGKRVFENRGALNFDNTMRYQKVDCNQDEHGCIASVGYYWSSLKKDCIRPLGTGIRLHAGAEASSRAKPAFLLFSEDKKQAELFLPETEASVLLQRQGQEGNPYWENGRWKLYPWKGYVLKQDDKLAYAGQ
ncbi:MAG: hypothetical protein H7Z75_22690 [Ferruginibacter sp.]|nr:hypothetical protein [Cytophagales bacterium]